MREVGPGDSIELGGLRIDAVEADHDGRRHPGGVRAPALGYVLRGSRSIYFAGDTDLFAGMAAFAPLDVALLPMAGWGSKVGPAHLDGRRNEGSTAPAEAFLRAAAQLAPDVRVEILPVAGTLALD